MLDIKGLCVNYGPVEALRNVTMTIGEGQVVSIIGHNGAGKTTLLKTISGLLRPVWGSVEFDGQIISGRKPDAIVRLGISHAPEGRQVFEQSTVYQNLEMGGYTRRDKAGIKEDMDYYFQQFPILYERRAQKAGTLSGGEQQMLAIARALMSRPRILLLDEPSLGLAPKIADEVFENIRRIRSENVSIVIVEQNAYRALELSDRAYVLSNGEIFMEGTADALMCDDKVRAAYLGV